MLRREISAKAQKRKASLIKQFNSLRKKHAGYTQAEFARLHGVSPTRMGILLNSQNFKDGHVNRKIKQRVQQITK